MTACRENRRRRLKRRKKHEARLELRPWWGKPLLRMLKSLFPGRKWRWGKVTKRHPIYFSRVSDPTNWD